MKRMFLLLILALALAGCGDYLSARADYLRNVGAARRDLAAAQRLEAQQELEQAEAQRAIAEAQADALKANATLPTLAVALALVAILAVASVASVAIWLRTPATEARPPTVVVVQPPQRTWRIETPEGAIEVLPEPGETRAAYLARLRGVAELLGGGRLLPPGR